MFDLPKSEMPDFVFELMMNENIKLSFYDIKYKYSYEDLCKIYDAYIIKGFEALRNKILNIE